jgi:acetoin utilization protein AcuB
MHRAWLMGMFEPVRVADVMTPLPLTIDIEDSLATAHSRMLQLEVRHLPVLSRERVVGMLSERDIGLTAGLGMELERVSVGAAMSPGPFIVPPEEKLATVLMVMAEHKLGSAVVMQQQRLLGVFTSTDALRLLSTIVKHSGPLGKLESPPSAVAQRLEREQSVLNSIQESARRTALAALDEDEASIQALPTCSRNLDQAVLRYFELEQELLIPLLDQASADGALRAQVLRERYNKVRRQIHMAHVALQRSDPEHLAAAVLSMCDA